MSERYTREILRRNIAQICQIIGWHGIHSTPLDILVHLLEKYLRTLGTQTNRYSEQFNRSEPNLHDLGLVFRDLNLQIPELAEYTCSIPSAPSLVHVEKFPKPRESHLNFLKPGSHEVVTRPMHVHEHLPPMYPEKEIGTAVVAGTIEILQTGVDNDSSSKPAYVNKDISLADSPEESKDLFKRPTDPISSPSSKRARLLIEQQEITREISSVMMTMSGFLSPAREGKLPEARPPTILSEKHYDKHKIASHRLQLPKATVVEKSDKKAKKSKLSSGKIMKGKRKGKSRKGECGTFKECLKSNKYTLGHLLKPQQNKTLPNSFIPLIKESSEPMKVSVAPRTNPLSSDVVEVKKEPVYYAQDPNNFTHGEEAIPVLKKIPLCQSPLANSSVDASKPKESSYITDTEVKMEALDKQEKLTSQPDKSKINIFKRISNKSKEEKYTSPVILPEKSQSDAMISKSPTLNFSNEIHRNENFGIKIDETIANYNYNYAVDWPNGIDLRAHEIINIDDDSLDITPVSSSNLVPDDPHPSASVGKKNHPEYPKEDASVGIKVKKEKKHKVKKDKAAILDTKMLRKQQAYKMIRCDQNTMKSGRPPKSNRTNNVSEVPQIPVGFSFLPVVSSSGRNLVSGPGLVPIPNLNPGSNYLAGLANSPTTRDLTSSNFLSNSFVLDSDGTGFIPGPSFLSGNFGPGVASPITPITKYPCPSRAPLDKIPSVLRRPSLEVIQVDKDNERSLHKPTFMSQENERHNENSMATYPNSFQQHQKKSRKEHIIRSLKLSPVQPDITIELNPPKEFSEQLATKEKIPPPLLSPLPHLIQVPYDPKFSSNLTESPSFKEQLTKVSEMVEVKKDKSHKKEKKGKECLKIKKKKDKNKDKSEKKLDKQERFVIKEKTKKKKEKKKEKSSDGLVPKLTLKLFSSNSNSPVPTSSADVFRLNIKPVVKKEEPECSLLKDEALSREHSTSPELAQISALVTRPPKPKHSKHNIAADSEAQFSLSSENSPNKRKNHPPSASHSKYKRILFKPLSKRRHFEDDIVSLSDDSAILQPPPPIDKLTGPLPTPYYLDTHGNKIWVCPACGQPDNGSPMIGCDGCDGWYHWVCVGITEEPGATEDWFCKLCVAKRTAVMLAGVTSGKKRGRKPK